MHQRDTVFSQDAVDAQKANQIYRETVEKANVAILEAKKKLEMSRELIEGNELESHDEKIKVMKENQNQGWFSSATKKATSKVDGPRKHERSVTSGPKKYFWARSSGPKRRKLDGLFRCKWTAFLVKVDGPLEHSYVKLGDRLKTSTFIPFVPV